MATSNRMVSRVPRRNRRRALARTNGSLQPPQLQTSVQIHKVFRFQASAANTVNLSFQDLGDLLCMASAANAAYQLANAVRLRKIEMWGPPASTLVPVTVSVEWLGSTAGSVGSQNNATDTSVGSTRVAHVSAVPPKLSQTAQWQLSTNSGFACQLKYPANCILDLHYSITLRGDSASAQAVTAAVAGATTGQVYLRALCSTTSTDFAPVSFVTI